MTEETKKPLEETKKPEKYATLRQLHNLAKALGVPLAALDDPRPYNGALRPGRKVPS